ncbi:uncharacterized protein CLUP02_08025 [Colletotrichum lupini]|uniref:A-kinase anchor protein 7-like phosphoesterase domain-containing protein n=1 Tax=Colletotrichum lupini TaxID=145971 RepID=A0A9Q8WH32_9PEZI|nr:uncharacterized protein CLUP02_08025 [Colletotrichum lupini]UQC82537.1 hypothetical protein CLUP02_08025 [Colletotrichum lupini]
MRPTHFLCIPLVTPFSRPQLSASLRAFKSYITSPDNFGITASAVRPLGTLHLTLGVMNLPEAKDLARATEVLQSIKPLLPTKPLKISLHGLGTFPGAVQSHVDILFAHPTCLDHDFDSLCHKIRHVFEDAGVVDKTGFGLSLHATIINARKTPTGGIDATEMIKKYWDYMWMESVPLEKIGICRMGAEKKGDDEEYPLHSLITRAIADGHFTREELDWLSQKSLTDVGTAGLKDTTAALKDLFGKNDIPWVISGGWALILYGEPDRNTPDIDIVVQITMPELRKLLEADGRFVIPADDWWPDDAHLQVYYQSQGKYFDVDMIIAGQKNSVKEVGSIAQFVSTTHGTKELAIPVIRIGPIFISKVYGLASPKRKKHEQDVKDISWLIDNHSDDLVNMPKDLPLDKRQVVVDYLTRFKSASLPKAKELLDL